MTTFEKKQKGAESLNELQREIPKSPKAKKLAAEKISHDSTTIEARFLRTIQENARFQEIVGTKKFAELTTSDFELLSQNGMNLKDFFWKPDHRIGFGKNPNLSGSLLADAVFQDVRMKKLRCNGREYIRTESGFYLSEAEQKKLSKNTNIDFSVPLTLNHGDVIEPIMEDIPAMSSSEDLQKLVETRKVETENERVRLATQDFLKKKNPETLRPQSNNEVDVKAFFTVLTTIFGHIFKDTFQ